MNEPHYHINLFWSAEDECWIADVPDLRPCSSHGDTPEEVDYQTLIQEAVAVGDLKRVAELSELAKKQQLEKKKKATDENIQRVQRIAALKAKMALRKSLRKSQLKKEGVKSGEGDGATPSSPKAPGDASDASDATKKAEASEPEGSQQADKVRRMVALWGR